jgi:hypothetical protein
VQARGERRTAILPKTGTRRGPENARTQRHPAFAGQRRTALLHDPRLRGVARGRHSGRIAQLVEQLTLNQRVLGSSPSAPTKSRPDFNNLFGQD